VLSKRSIFRGPVFDGKGNKRRIRRRPDQLEGEKHHVCPYQDCEKSYTSKCSLYLHIKRNHGENEILKEGRTAPVRINSKVKKGVDIYKVFKASDVSKYESKSQTENASDIGSVSELLEENKTPSNEVIADELIERDHNDNTAKKDTKPQGKLDKADVLTTCETQKTKIPIDAELPAGRVQITLIQDAQYQIFTWEQDESRKHSLESCNIPDPIAIFAEEPELLGIDFNDANMSVEQDYQSIGESFSLADASESDICGQMGKADEDIDCFGFYNMHSNKEVYENEHVEDYELEMDLTEMYGPGKAMKI
jgi:hypothetical protein